MRIGREGWRDAVEGRDGMILGEIAKRCARVDFPPFGSVFTELELWEAFMRQFLPFFDFG